MSLTIFSRLNKRNRIQPIIGLILLLLVSSCGNSSPQTKVLVSTPEALEEAIASAKAGTDIVMANGIWNDIQIRFAGQGTENAPIRLVAETAGEVIIQGDSDLKLGGKHLVVDGLHFKNGQSPSRAVIGFKIDDDQLAFHSRVTNVVIEGFNKSQRNKTDLWVQFHGRYNQLDHSYLAGKSNRGPTVRVDLEGNQSIKNHHRINNNHFGPRPPKGGPSAETIQIGNSYTSMAPSYTVVADNYFERCNGEVEIISSKTNFNEFRNNVFYKSEGSLVTRHGNYCTVDGNYFIGDKNSKQIGGIRLIGTGHWVTNNYFYNLKGESFRSPLAVMNGIPKSPLNRYIQVTDVVIAHNSWINCTSPLQFGVGSNVDQRDVLPASEIRSDRPIRTIFANNLIHNSIGDPSPLVAHDKIDGINFKNNIINNQGTQFTPVEGLSPMDFSLLEKAEGLYFAEEKVLDLDVFTGFEFETIATDLLGTKRALKNAPGAVSDNSKDFPAILAQENYGPAWFTDRTTKNENPTNHQVSTAEELIANLASAKAEDVITLAEGNYSIANSLVINKKIQLVAATDATVRLQFSGEAGSALFEMHPKGELDLQNISLKGTGKQYAFAPLQNEMSSLYNVTVNGGSISDFDYILKAYKYSFAEHLNFTDVAFSNSKNGLELSEEIEDKGEYNAENISIVNCSFDRIQSNVLDYYRGGYDESTVGGNLVVRNSSFTNSGAKEKSGILLNTYGIINVVLDGNTFKNNRVKQVAQLWGAKNNTHTDNTVVNSGKIVVEENLKLKLLY